MDREYRPEGPQRFIYGRRQAPRFKESYRRLLDELLPKLAIDLPEPVAPASLAALGLNVDGPIWLEIGFGGGEHLAATATANPEVTMIGVEPYFTGVAKLLSAIDQHKLGNIRVLVDDARLLLHAMPNSSLERAFILYPDPWPKLRHNKRRIINDETVNELARLLKPGAELRIATDHADYRRWILALMRRQRGFEWLAQSKKDWQERPAGQCATRYEAKALRAGRTPVYLRYRRVI